MLTNQSYIFCELPFWNQNMTWNGDSPQLTQCFSQTILPLIPITILLLLLPYDIVLLKKWSKKWSPIPNQWRISLNLLLIASLVVISISQLTKTLWQFFSNEIHLLLLNDLFSPIIKILTYLLVIILIIIFRKNGYKNSTSIPIFWFTIFLISSINLWSVLSALNQQLFNIIAQSLEVCISLLALIISSLTPKVSSFESLVSESECCPLQDFNVFSRIFYFWTQKLLILGYRTKLDANHLLLPLCYYLKAKNAFKCFTSADKKYNSKLLASKKLLPLLWCTAWIPYVVSALLELVLMTANYIQPYFLGKLIDFISGAVAEPQWHGLCYAILYCFFVTIARIIDCHAYTFMTLATYRLKSAMTSAIYSKMLKLSPSARREYTAGEINNLMGVDIDEICGFVQIINTFYTVPLSLTIGLFFLWNNLGPSSLTLLAVMIILGPITTFIMRKMDKSQTTQMKLKDKRMEQISEILNNVKLLKLFAWEKPFIERVTKTRQKELNNLRSLGYWSSAIDVLWVVAPMLVAGASFTVYSLTSSVALNAKTAFVSLSIFNILRFPMAILPSALTRCIRAIVSFKRIKKFFNSEELDNYRNNMSDEEINTSDVLINLKDCSFTWSLDEEPVLKEINLKVLKNSLVAIVGKVGSGKSSIFSALMGDMYQTKGSTKVLGSMAFVPQSAWIQNTSLRQNITFVSDFDSVKYEKVIDSCALKPDLDILPAKDETEIGEKGINLSGGQKQRVSLARAVYQDSDIYLLDDPLSAVDAHVAQHLFEHVIGPNGLLSKKTRLLATHHISFLRNVDQIIVMKDGEIVGFGDYEQLFQKGLLSEDLLESVVENEEKSVKLNRNLSKSMDKEGSRETISSHELNSSFSSIESIVENSRLIEEENQEIGNVKFGHYLNYFSRCGYLIIAIALISEQLFNCCEIGANYWLNIWTSNNTSTFILKNNDISNLSIYLIAILFEALFVIIACISIYTGSVRASNRLHKEMLFSVLRTPLSFFDTNPNGRILNRFNHDITEIDEEIPYNFIAFLQQILWIPLVYTVVWTTNVYMGFQIVIVNIIFYIIYKLFLLTSRQLKRLESISLSPIFNHFNETISGVLSIRAYGVQNTFIDVLHDRLDNNVNVSRHQFATMMWLEMWTGVLGLIITFSTAIMIVMNRDVITPGLAGFVLIYCVEVVNDIAYTIRITAQLETAMIAMERVQQYIDLKSENHWESHESQRPHSEWPQNGKIEFKNYSTSYRPELEPVLKDLNLTVKSGEKVGIVGRTGAGKSSMTLALFRIIEPTNGRIMIDDIDVTRIGLHDLRSKLTIIPQEPNLFAGTLRLNLDPFDEHSDEKLWSALESAHLKDLVTSFADGLSHEITEGGDNLSAGQRQLICLSRALLRDTKVLILDEATAACDSDTDSLIQSTIKEKFCNSTVLTIAHRLNTILDYNRVIVLDNGRIVENGSPQELLTKSDSIFYHLAKEARIV